MKPKLFSKKGGVTKLLSTLIGLILFAAILILAITIGSHIYTAMFSQEKVDQSTMNNFEKLIDSVGELSRTVDVGTKYNDFAYYLGSDYMVVGFDYAEDEISIWRGKSGIGGSSGLTPTHSDYNMKLHRPSRCAGLSSCLCVFKGISSFSSNQDYKKDENVFDCRVFSERIKFHYLMPERLITGISQMPPDDYVDEEHIPLAMSVFTRATGTYNIYVEAYKKKGLVVINIGKSAWPQVQERIKKATTPDKNEVLELIKKYRAENNRQDALKYVNYYLKNFADNKDPEYYAVLYNKGMIILDPNYMSGSELDVDYQMLKEGIDALQTFIGWMTSTSLDPDQLKRADFVENTITAKKTIAKSYIAYKPILNYDSAHKNYDELLTDEFFDKMIKALVINKPGFSESQFRNEIYKEIYSTYTARVIAIPSTVNPKEATRDIYLEAYNRVKDRPYPSLIASFAFDLALTFVDLKQYSTACDYFVVIMSNYKDEKDVVMDKNLAEVSLQHLNILKEKLKTDLPAKCAALIKEKPAPDPATSAP